MSFFRKTTKVLDDRETIYREANRIIDKATQFFGVGALCALEYLGRASDAEHCVEEDDELHQLQREYVKNTRIAIERILCRGGRYVRVIDFIPKWDNPYSVSVILLNADHYRVLLQQPGFAELEVYHIGTAPDTLLNAHFIATQRHVLNLLGVGRRGCQRALFLDSKAVADAQRDYCNKLVRDSRKLTPTALSEVLTIVRRGREDQRTRGALREYLAAHSTTALAGA